jgi:negative regulator of genetic competence, sporulation and motility
MSYEEDYHTTSYIYFAVHPRSDKSEITVVDLQSDMSYEKDDWTVVDPFEFTTRDEAIKHAIQLATEHGLTYRLFRSRYNSRMSEYLGEFQTPASVIVSKDNLERIMMKVSEDDWRQMIADIKTDDDKKRIDSVGGIRLRLYRLLTGG